MPQPARQGRPGPRPGRAGARPAAGRSSSLPYVILIAVVVLAGIAAIVASRGGEDEAADGVQIADDVQVDGEPLPPLPESGADPAVGMPVPALSGTAVEDAPLTITPGDGTPGALIYLAHWCPHCQNEVPAVQEWLDDGNQPDGTELFAVSTSVNEASPNYPPSAWLDREGWSVPTLADDAAGTAAQAAGLTAFPFFVFYDAEGNVVERRTGEVPVEEIEAILAGTAGGS